jgi:uracil phosphoribosyltransferase
VPGSDAAPPTRLHVVQHPLVEDVLASLRDKATPPHEFRRLARRVSLLLVAEATRDLDLQATTVETPLQAASVRRLAGRIVAVPVLRAGLGMLEAFLELVPSAQVGYFGLERNEQTAVARRYYEKVPKDLGQAVVFLLDPMLATGGSAVMAIEGLRALGARNVRLLSIVAAPEGVATLAREAPETTLYTAALDRALDERRYIVPGLGDFGDRLYGT